jgi:hemolysin D
LDPTQAGADRDRLAHDLLQAQLDVARLTALKTAAEQSRPPTFVAPANAPQSLVDDTRTALVAQAAQQAAKVADLSEQISQKEAEAAEVSAQVDEINATLPMLADKARIYLDLTQRGYGTSLGNLDARQQLTAAQHELAVQEQREKQDRDARSALVAQRDEIRAQYAADVLADLRKAQASESELSQQLIQANNKSSQTELRSPITGVVDQLSIHTLHGVVTPAQHIMIVVPDGRNLLIEAHLSDRDVGFVHAGQPVKVKIQTYDFTRYGLIEGEVLDVSRDVISPGERQGSDSQISPPGGSGASSQMTYVARISLSRTTMVIDGQSQQLRPGMAVTADILTGRRSIINYLLSPLARRTQESLHER